MAKLNLKTVNKKTKDQLITFVLVIAVYIVVQIMEIGRASCRERV